MKNLFLTLFLVFIGNSIFSQNRRSPDSNQKPSAESLKTGAFIDINAPSYPESSYNIAQLVKEVLITGSSTCIAANVSNVQVSPNTVPSNQSRSWGYFNKATTNFPFSKGVVLTTGFARRAGNNFQATLGDQLSPSSGDNDLATAIGVSNTQLHDATFIEFDFTPSSTEVSFRYLFASTEYQQDFPCSFTDGFALLLKKVGDPTYTNLAVLPNGLGPVSVTNIVPSGMPCPPKNPQFFGGLNTSNIETNFRGRTIPLTAKATVIPGQTYHFKMVLADFKDTEFDSGVFLEAGSFDIGVKILDPAGVQLPSSITLCDSSSQVLTASVQTGNPTYQWLFNNTPIPGATSASHTATQPGVYSVEVNLPGNQCPGTANITVSAGTSPTVQNATLTLCTSAPSAVFNLTTAQPSISITPGAIFSYYINQADANAANSNTIATPDTFSSAGNQTIHVLVKNGLCSKIATLQLIKAPKPTVAITSSSSIICFGGNASLTSSQTTGNTWSTGETTQSITISNPGTYTLTSSNGSCISDPATITIAAENDPNVQITGNLVLCNSSTQLNASSTGTGNTYTWSNGSTGNSISVSSPGVYTVTVNTPTGCQYQKSVTIVQESVPAPTIAASSTVICGNNSIILTSSLATGNTWSNGETTQSTTVTTPGTYTLTNTNGICTSAPASITITAENDPNIQIAGNLVICESPTQLTASANGTGNIYTWSNGSTGNTISVSTPGIYTVTVKTPANCQYTKTVTVTQAVIPTVQNSSLNQCSNSATATFDLTTAQPNISTTSGVSYDYYTNQADALAGNTNIITNPTTFVSGNATIYVRVKFDPCSKVAQLQLIIQQKPIPIITPSAPVMCSNNAIILTSNFLTGNTWSNGQTTQTITVSSPGTYTLINTNGICTSDPVSVTITQDLDPNVQIAGNLTFCEGSSTLLTGTAIGIGNSFSWSNGTTGATNLITAAGIYTLTITTAGGCQYQKSVTVSMDPLITVNIATPTSITCSNLQVTLDATGSLYQPGATFLWTSSGGGNIVSAGNTLTPIVNNSGTYTLTITSATPSGCIKQASVTVIKNTTIPVVSVTSTALKICKGQSVTLTATGAATYTWTGLTGTGNTQIVSPTSTTTYTVTGNGTNGCTSQELAKITINVIPEIESPLRNIEICQGDMGILDAGSGTNYTYSWSTGATSQIINVSLAGTYTVTINNGYCSKTFSAVVSYITVPKIIEIIYKDPTLTINAKNNSNLPLEYSIDGGITWQSSSIFQHVLRNTQYSIRVRNKETSCDTSTEYYTHYMTNVITPNYDGINDVIDFTPLSQYANFGGGVFDRYGKEIFKVTPKTPIWNGKYIGGGPLPTGTYWYRLSWDDSITKKAGSISGWILLKNRD